MSTQLLLSRLRPGLPTWLVRTGVVLVLTGSILLAVWSWHREREADRHLRQASAAKLRVADELSRIEMRWDAAAAARVDTEFGRTEVMLFSGEDDLAAWQAELQKRTRHHLFEHAARLGAPEVRATDGDRLATTLAVVDLHPAPGPRAGSAYRELLGFTRAMQALHKRVDLLEMSVSGDTDTVTQAQAVLQLWSREGTH